jgi:hypothetical protein
MSESCKGSARNVGSTLVLGCAVFLAPYKMDSVVASASIVYSTLQVTRLTLSYTVGYYYNLVRVCVVNPV